MKEMTGDEFHEILKKIIEEKVSVDHLLSIPDVYECLCEEYNNEVLEVWEQKKDQADQEEEELFAFVLCEKTGEKEVTYEHLVVAKNIQEAEKKASKFGSKWYPFDETYQFVKHKKVHIFHSGTVYVTIMNLRKVGKDAWMKEMYREALIG